MKKRMAPLAAGLVLLAVLGGLWVTNRYYVFRWRLLPRDAAVLDLQEEALTASDYHRLREALPGCRILWKIPFQGQLLSSEEETLTITSLPEEDLSLLDCFTELKTLDASGCEDYETLLRFAAAHPQVQLRYRVVLGGDTFENDARDIRVADPDVQELREKLPWLPALETLTLTGTLPEPEELEELGQAYPQVELRWEISLGEEVLLSTAEQLDLRGSTLSGEAVKTLLRWLPEVRTVDLTGSTLTDEEGMDLADAYEECFFLWEMTIGSRKIPTDAREVDISGEIQESTAFLESRLPYFPRLERVIMSHCGLDDETMDALNRRYEDIRFVWTVKIGNMDVRTDETWFYPVKVDRNAVVDSGDLYPLRYCTDMVCIDVGHMWGVNECSWAAFMPDLKYLVLAYTSVADLSPLSGLENLVFLEIFHTPVKDYSPLTGCTGLEDLNLSMTTGDYRPLLEMPWLKNVWWHGIAGSYGLPCSGAHEILPEALPEINWHFHGKYAAYKSGWRKLPNYYAMRDYLGMFYLT